MAKQQGLYRIRGKFEGKSYFHPKYSPAPIFRRISDAISENVLHSPAYETLRLNSYEFGGCSAFAAQMVDFAGLRVGNFFLKNFHAKLTRLMVEIMREDKTHIVGTRQLVGFAWQGRVLQWLSQQQKNNPSKYFGLLQVSADGYNMQQVQPSMDINLKAPEGWGQEMLSLGVTDIEVSTQVCGARLVVPATDGRYFAQGQESDVRKVVTFPLDGDLWDESITHNMSNYDVHNVSNECSFAIVALRPKRVINRQSYYIPRLDTIFIVPFNYT